MLYGTNNGIGYSLATLVPERPDPEKEMDKCVQKPEKQSSKHSKEDFFITEGVFFFVKL